MFNRRIYLDYASLTPIDSRVIREVKKFSNRKYANPSSIYKEGILAKNALIDARNIVGDFLHAHADEIVFTSGGTESNVLALNGVVFKAIEQGIKKPHIIISNIEHSSIIETANELEKNGCEITRLAVNKEGIISLDDLKKTIKSNTVLVSIMTVNNEIGSIQPIKEIASIVRKARKNDSIYPLFHTDAAQALLYIDINTEKIGVDLITLDGGKVYGPRGVGALYIRRGILIQPLILGGGQERGMRSGTENIPGIMGFAKALHIAKLERNREVARILELKKSFYNGLKLLRSDLSINSDINSPHILNVSIPGIDNEFFVLRLDAKGIACSTKSSCLRDEDESYVLKSIGANSKDSIRFSFGRWTKTSDIKKALKVIGKVLNT